MEGGGDAEVRGTQGVRERRERTGEEITGKRYRGSQVGREELVRKINGKEI